MQVHSFSNKGNGSTEVGCLAYDHVDGNVQIWDLIKAIFHYAKVFTKYQTFCWTLGNCRVE